MQFEISLRASPRFLEDLGRLAKGHPKLKELTKKKLEHLAHDHVLIPLMLYAKNEHEDVPLRQLLQVMDMVTRRAQRDR